jgi:hypothetical protein
VGICALKMAQKRDQSGDEAHEREVGEAFTLFTTGGTGASAGDAAPRRGRDAPEAITMAHLKRVAAVLKEEVPDELLRDMILEANGGAGVGRGVNREEFDAVMKRAGVWR